MCICVYVCMCVYVCVCVCVCVHVCAEGQSYGTLHLAICTYVQSGCISILFVDKESLQKEAIRSMTVKILTTNSSLVNGTSNATQM